jgi:hypothetical protein
MIHDPFLIALGAVIVFALGYMSALADIGRVERGGRK